MSLTIKYLIPALFASTILLVGCATTNSRPANSGDGVSVSPTDSLNYECYNLRQRTLLNDDVFNSPDQIGINPNNRAWLYNEYERLDCDAVIDEAKAERVVE